ncbi:putative mediator of RNA polymerase II transcription subunit 26c [Forsythia ovata]|uniref:Mediator of RNA polymerase II transcription subunit 26c n=1 Tax=Forsythia ovata TaxID=205694 RepID=A0ABD1PVF0_9LAMI
MDLDMFRSFMEDSGLDVWTVMDMAITVACEDHEKELKNRRDGIIERLYAPAFSRCDNCVIKESDGKVTENIEKFQSKQELQAEKMMDMIEEDDDDENRKILEIKNLLDDPNQSEGCLVELLQSLADMNITFKTLKETDIGRHATRLRKHSSNDVRKLVKILIRKWKDAVDEWVRLNTPLEETDTFYDHRRIDLQNGVKAEVLSHGDVQNGSVSHYLTSAKKRLHDNVQEAQTGKNPKTPQIIDFKKTRKTENGVFIKNGGAFPRANCD